MSISRFSRLAFLSAWVIFVCGSFVAVPADPAKKFRVSAVQENQVWIEGGLADGLEQGMEGEIGYEILVAGQKKRILPAKVRLSRVEDQESIGTLYEVSGIINIGYTAQFIPKPSSELLVFLNKRASESYAAREFKLAQQYYLRILEILPEDAFARHQLKDCEAQIEKQNALMRERRNIPYYREVIRTSLASDKPESRELAQTYIDKILAVEPEDPEALKSREHLAQLTRDPAPSIATSAKPAPQPQAPAKSPDPPSTPAPAADASTASEQTPPALPAPDQKLRAEAPSTLKDMIRIDEGVYPIGSLPGKTSFENEFPKHAVYLESFYIDKHEVTNEEYKKFCDATGHAYPEYFLNREFPPGMARKPVVMVSWTDADAYARWAGKRLPTEFEWEAAAAGNAGKIWPWGNRWISGEANTREMGEDSAADVGSHPFDVSDFGVYDMAGNVSEWTQNWYQPYPGNRRKEKEYGEQFRVLRGGSSKASKDFARTQFRARLPVGFRSIDLGFRCAVSAKEANP